MVHLTIASWAMAKSRVVVFSCSWVQERYDKLLEAAESGDKYGLHRIASTSSWKVRSLLCWGASL